jgi:DNA-binding beta-propeller fold protein YncE
MSPRHLLAFAAVMLAATTPAAAETPLSLEAKIPLGDVRGRIDHLAIDLKRQRLLVAELGNNSVGIVDLGARKTLTMSGFREPQGVGYEPSSDTIYVANAGDGSVRIITADDLNPAGRIEFGDDADNIRIDFARKLVLVGYGTGEIATIDPETRAIGRRYHLGGHPEGFQLDETGTRLFVNVPEMREITVIDLPNGAVRSVATPGLRSNFPMAVDGGAKRVVVVFRSPPVLLAVASSDGHVLSKAETCSDADDVFVDSKRKRVYVICGAGEVDVFELEGDGYKPIGKIPTVSGARTGLFVPEFDRLYVAVRAAPGEPAAIWVFRPIP